MSKFPNFNTPYEAGYDAIENGPSVRNCHFGFFSTPERTKEWERGQEDARSELNSMPKGRAVGVGENLSGSPTSH